MTRNETDLIVVGAGPAGIAAALEATRVGMRVVLLDENDTPGGRIWQALEARGATAADDASGLAMIRDLRASPVDQRFGASVWGIQPGGTEPGATVFWTESGEARSRRAGRIILATGTTERPLPLPGWTLPGVMTVGAAQIAWKTAGLLPDQTTWIVGQGPLTLLYAAQVARAGGTLGGILDLGLRSNAWRALPYLPGAIADIWRGLGWINELRRAGIPRFRVTDPRAEGHGALRRISFRVNGVQRTEPADLLLLHDGVIPSIQLTRALGCAHEWVEGQRCWRPVTNAQGETSVPGIFVAGDGAGVGGAAVAVFSGRITALGCAGRGSGDRDVVTARAGLAQAMGSRRFIDTMFAPLTVAPADDTLVCRCEEVTAGQINAAVRLGCQGLNQLKAFTRCGMGPCQGRMCGTTAAEVVAAARGLHPRDIEPFRTRFPARPLTVGELAGVIPEGDG